MNYLIGHLVGDYLLQSERMASRKRDPGLGGWAACLLHCSLWTLSVLFFTGWWTPWAAVAVFASHLVLDRTRLVDWFMRVSRKGTDQWLTILADNAFHLLFLWLIARYVA